MRVPCGRQLVHGGDCAPPNNPASDSTAEIASAFLGIATDSSAPDANVGLDFTDVVERPPAFGRVPAADHNIPGCNDPRYMNPSTSFRFSLKAKAAAAITVLFLGMAAIIAGVQSQFIRAGLLDRVAEQQSRVVTGIANVLDQRLETSLLALTRQALAIPPEVLAHPESFQAYLARQPAMLLLFDGLLIFSPTGEVLADAPAVAGRRGIKAGDREYMQRSIATGKPVISAPYIGRGVQRPIVTITAPILDKDGRLVGFLGGNLDLLKARFLGSFATTSIGQTGYLFVITKDSPSVYVTHPDPSLILEPSTGPGGMLVNERALAGKWAMSEGVDGNGVHGLYTYKSLATVDWLVATNYPLAEALAPVAVAERRLWTISLGVAMLLAPLVWLLAWYLHLPLLRLHEDVQRLRRSSGAISPSLQHRHDEIGALARTFNALITERQQAAEALRRSTQLLDNIVENIPVAIQLKTVQDDFRIVMWNKAAETMFGLPGDRVLGRTALETWSAEEIAMYREADELAVASNGQEFAHRVVSTASRGNITSHIRKVPLFDAGGVATHLLVIMDDITDRVASENKLAQSAARLRGAAESSLDAFLIFDSVRDSAGEIRDFRLCYLNANAERLLSRPSEQAIGQLLCEMFPTQRNDGHFDKYAAVVRTGVPLDEEYKVTGEGVNATWLHYQIVRLEDGIAVTASDISSRKVADEELRNNRTFLQSLIDNAPMSIYVKDVRREHYGEIVIWNTGAETIAGVSAEQAIGRTGKDIFLPDIYQNIEAHDRAILESPMVAELAEHPFRGVDGALVFLHSIAVPLFGSDDKPEFILRISEDITSRRRQQQELDAKTSELIIVSDASPLGMFRTDAKGHLTYANRSYELISGLNAMEAMADGWSRAIHPDDRDRVMRQWEAATQGLQPFASLYRYRHPNGRVVWASVRAVQVMVDGAVVGYVGSVDDITARREAEQALQASESRLRTIADTMPAWIAYIDRLEIYQFTNAAFERAFDLTREQVKGRNIRDVLGDAGYEKVKPYVDRVLGGQPVTFEREQLVDGGIRWVEASYVPEIDGESQEVVGFHAMLRDVTAQKVEKQRLLRLSQIDGLTGLANRVGFEQHLRDAMTEARQSGQALAVMYLDIDHFKQINDTHGHAVGDAVLLAFAQRVKGTLRKTDMVARLGGDEFVVVMEHMLDQKTATRLAAKTLQAIRQPMAFADDGEAIAVTASIGIAFFDGGAIAAGQLVAEADAMLYDAKRSGRNGIRVAAWPHEVHEAEATVH